MAASSEFEFNAAHYGGAGHRTTIDNLVFLIGYVIQFHVEGNGYGRAKSVGGT